VADETWSNQLSDGFTITRDAVAEAIRDVEQMAYAYAHGRLGRGRLTIPDPLPPWVYDLAQDMGWIDEQGNVTQKYWQAMAEAKRRE